MDKRRRYVLVFFIPVALLLAVLAASMANISFSPSLVITKQVEQGGAGFRFSADFLTRQHRLLLTAYVLLLVFTILSMFMSREGRQRLLMFTLLFGLALALMVWAGPRLAERALLTPMPPVSGELSQEAIAPAEELALPEAVIEEKVQTPEWLVTAIGLALALLLALLGGLVWMALGRRRPLSQTLADEAAQAISALEAGEDYEDVIIRCYAQMSQALQEERGLVREVGMTPHEFERLLVKLNFPPSAVQALTHLFEDARYGGIGSAPESAAQATACLNDIVAHCRRLKEMGL